MNRPIINNGYTLMCNTCGSHIEESGVYFEEDSMICCATCNVHKNYKKFDNLANGGEIDNRFDILDL